MRFHLEQKCPRSLLATYEQERRPIAQQLIDFDREYLELFANPSLQFDDFLNAYKTAMRFTTGIGIQYSPSLIVQPYLLEEKINGAEEILAPGMRLPDFQMVNQADGVPTTLYHRFTMNGQFRLLIFAGDISIQPVYHRLLEFGQWLVGFLRMNPGMETITVHSSARANVELMKLPEIFHPWNDADGWDYSSVYADDESYHDGHGQAYKRCGIDRNGGHVVIMRPDGYASLICRMEQTSQISTFFQNLFLGDSTEVSGSARL